MRVETREWGSLEIDERSIVRFKDGLLGFEDLHSFVFVDAEEFRPFVWFLSVDDPEVGFAVADPFYFSNTPYDVSLSAGDEVGLALDEGDEIAIFVVVAIDENGSEITANLKGPLVLNMRTRLARQLAVYGASYAVRQPMINRRIVPLHNAIASAAVKGNAA